MTKKQDEKWCLVCAGHSNDGVHLLGDEAEKLRDNFNKVLKAPVPKKPPSDCICKRCDRTIRRLAEGGGEAAEREIEYLRKTYRKTVIEYNAKAEIRKQKLRKAAEAFMIPKMKNEENKPEKKITVAATRWRIMAKAGSTNTKLPVPVSVSQRSSGRSSPDTVASSTTETISNGTVKPSSPINTTTDTTSDASDGNVTTNNINGNNIKEVKHLEKSSLIKHDSLEEVREDSEDNNNPGSEVSTESTTSMAFNFFKKKSIPKDETPIVKNEETTMEIKLGQPDDGAIAEGEQVLTSVSSVKDAIKDIEAQDGDTEKNKDKSSNGEISAGGDVIKTKEQPADNKAVKKKEDTPLIEKEKEKESKVRDTGPGVLCCNIL